MPAAVLRFPGGIQSLSCADSPAWVTPAVLAAPSLTLLAPVLVRRVNKLTFKILCDCLGPYISRSDSNFKRPVPIRQRVAFGLYYMAHASPPRITGFTFGRGFSTVHYIVDDFFRAVVAVFHRLINFPTGAQLVSTIRGFEALEGLPNVCGAIDCTHINMTAPSCGIRPHDYFDRNRKYSIVAQAVVDSKGRFLDVYVGWPGSVHDARVFANSPLHKRMASGEIMSEPVARFRCRCIPPYLVGDEGYPLSRFVMIPYPGRQLSLAHRRFNHSLSVTRVAVERAFGRLKGRWRLLNGTINFRSVNETCRALYAAFCLQNLCSRMNDASEEVWEDGVELCTTESMGNGLHALTSDGVEMRDHVADWVVHRVPQGA